MRLEQRFREVRDKYNSYWRIHPRFDDYLVVLSWVARRSPLLLLLLALSACGFHPVIDSPHQRVSVWTVPMYQAIADKTGHCNITWFATADRPVVLRMNGIQVAGAPAAGWKLNSVVDAGFIQESHVEVVDPTTAAVLWSQELGVSCYPDPGDPERGELYNRDGTLKGYEPGRPQP